MTLYIVRHGQTAENKLKIMQGHMPGNLTDEGRAQVRDTAEKLARMNIPFKCIVSSDLKRAAESAAIIAQRLSLPVVPMKILRERDWGKITGMKLPDAMEKYCTGGRWAFPEDSETETDAEILRRGKDAVKTLSELYGSDTIIAVTHGMFARNLIAAATGCSPDEVARLSNAETRKIEI